MSNNLNVVDVHNNNKFSNEHLEQSKKLINEDNRPDLYGNNIKFGKDGGRHLVPIIDIKWKGTVRNTQSYRAEGGNPKKKEVKNSITEFGYKLKHEPIALRRMSDGLHPLTGHTRKDILQDLGFTNVIANIYDGVTDEQASKFGLILNRPDDPRGSVSIQDIQLECENALEKEWIKPVTLDNILARVNEICGDSFLTANKRSLVATTIYNNYNDKNKKKQKRIMSWTSDTDIETWMTSNLYKDTAELMYMTTSFSQVSKAIFRAAKLYNENKKKVRVVVHTGILDAFDLHKCYKDRVADFKTMWDGKMKDLQLAVFNTSKPDKASVVLSDNIELYGALPYIDGDVKIIKYSKTAKIVNGN